MLLARIIGWFVLILAVIAVGNDLWGWYDTGRYQPGQLGELWLRIEPDSLLGARSLLEKTVGSWLWDPVLTTILQWPATLVLTAIAFLTIWASRPRDRDRRRRR